MEAELATQDPHLLTARRTLHNTVRPSLRKLGPVVLKRPTIRIEITTLTRIRLTTRLAIHATRVVLLRP